jgi:hypothetical protein
MKALMDGDNAQATTRWQRAIAMAEEGCDTFSIVACPSHPGSPIGFHQR